MMNNTTLHYFAGGHTAKGFVTLADSSLQGIRSVYVIKGKLASGASDFMREFGLAAAADGEEVWMMHSPFFKGGIDGIVLPRAGMAVLAESGLRGHALQCPGAAIREVDWPSIYDGEKLAAQEGELARLREAMKRAFAAAYERFAEALRVHDDWERIYISNMDKRAAEELAEQTANRLLGSARRTNGPGRTFLRFLGAATPEGAKDFVPQLTDGLKRWFLKGRPGTGKSTLLRKVASEAAARGFDAEVYRCGFDPDSVDMVIVRELGFAIFDSTAPHEYFPERDGDEIIDLYESCIRPGTDEAFAEEIARCEAAYKACMKDAIGHLAEARAHFDHVLQIYAGAVDYKTADLLKSELRREWNKHLNVNNA